jgi:hypothetical protein
VACLNIKLVCISYSLTNTGKTGPIKINELNTIEHKLGLNHVHLPSFFLAKVFDNAPCTAPALKKRLLCRYAAVKKEDLCRLAALTYLELYWLACELG